MTDLKTWFFTEDCYPDEPELSSYDSIRVDLPNNYCDPENARRLGGITWTSKPPAAIVLTNNRISRMCRIASDCPALRFQAAHLPS